MPLPVGPETEKEVEVSVQSVQYGCVCCTLCEMYHVYCCIQADPDDIAPTMPLPVGPETEEEEQEVSVQSVYSTVVCVTSCVRCTMYIAAYRVI